MRNGKDAMTRMPSTGHIIMLPCNTYYTHTICVETDCPRVAIPRTRIQSNLTLSTSLYNTLYRIYIRYRNASLFIRMKQLIQDRAFCLGRIGAQGRTGTVDK